MAKSLYRRILGDQFDALPPALRRFHDEPNGGKATAVFRVERGRGWLRNFVASVMRLPKASANAPVTLQVNVEGDRERWIRHIDGQRVETRQWADQGLLIEAFGPSTFSCALRVDGERLIYDFKRAWFLGIPMPKPLAPSVVSSTVGTEGGWHVSVRISAPLLGELVCYEGGATPS